MSRHPRTQNLTILRATCLIIALLLPLAFAHAQPAYAPGQILVKYRTASVKPALQNPLATRHGITAVEPLAPVRSAKIAAPHPFENLYRLRLTGDPVAAAADFATDPNILYAQPNHIHTSLDVPNDPRYPTQQNLAQINWQALRNALGPPVKEIVVAIIDSGVDFEHEDLRDNIYRNLSEINGQPGTDSDGNGYIDDIVGWDFVHAPELPGKGDYLIPDNDPRDESGHGTHVAGIIAAVANNNAGIAGIAPEAKIMALRAGISLQTGATFLKSDDLAAAILYAVENGAHVINMSWGSAEQAFIIRDALRYAAAQNIALVAAAGNSGTPGLFYPAGYGETIAVGAVDHQDRLASFSTTGSALDLVAPGVNILSTQPGNGYGARSGTSFAAPHISGLIALILSRYPDLAPEQMRTLLTRTARDLGTSGRDNRFGAGRIDAQAIIAHLGREQPIAQILTPDNDRAAHTAFDIKARAIGPDLLSHRLSYGIGQQPDTWIPLSTGGPQHELRHTWSIAHLPDTVAVLRLEAQLADAPIEDRVQVAIRKTAPAILDLSFGPVLDGDRIAYAFRWQTDQRTEGGIAFRAFGATAFDTLYTGEADLIHRIELPRDLPAGPLSFRILARGHNGHLTATEETTFTYVPFGVPGNGFAEIATLPDGFLPDRASDFDADGRPEIALMPYIEGAPFSPVRLYEYAENGFIETFQTADSFLPWAIGDLTGNGRPDLLGAATLRLMAFSGTETSPYPTRSILDLPGTWGGEIADITGDGQNEIIARSGTARGIRVLRRAPNGEFSELAFLPKPGTGIGDIGPRFVISDFTGDGHLEILAGDADGDLYMYAYRNNAFQLIYHLPGNGDVRWIGGGVDLDGDGQTEFIAARAFTDDNDPLNGHWMLEIYSADGPDSFRLEWSTRITGVITTGNGIAVGDVEGDGRPNLIVCLRPDLYVFRASGPNLYRPIWRADAGLTHRPLIADLNANGLPEILYNRDNAVRIVQRDESPVAFLSPQILRARPLGPESADIDWMQTPEAIAYRVYRAPGDALLSMHAEVFDRTRYVDSLLTEGQTYRYQIAALLPDSSELRSGIATLTPAQPPRAESAHILDNHRIAIHFSKAMGPESAEPTHYRLDFFYVAFSKNSSQTLDEDTSALNLPSSAILDRQNTRVVLTFSRRLPSVGVAISILGGADTAGIPLQPMRHEFRSNPLPDPYLQGADADKSGYIDFADFLLFIADFGTTAPQFDFNGDGIVNFVDFITFASLYGKKVE